MPYKKMQRTPRGARRIICLPSRGRQLRRRRLQNTPCTVRADAAGRCRTVLLHLLLRETLSKTMHMSAGRPTNALCTSRPPPPPPHHHQPAGCCCCAHSTHTHTHTTQTRTTRTSSDKGRVWDTCGSTTATQLRCCCPSHKCTGPSLHSSRSAQPTSATTRRQGRGQQHTCPEPPNSTPLVRCQVGSCRTQPVKLSWLPSLTRKGHEPSTRKQSRTHTRPPACNQHSQ